MSQSDLGVAEAASSSRTAIVPWGAWGRDEDHRLDVPDGWSIACLEPRGAAPLGAAAIAHALDTPIDAAPLPELAREARRVAIAVDDQTRPTPAGEILPHVLDRLEQGGIAREAVTVIVAIGAHRPPTAEELDAKIARARLGNVRVVVHDPAGELIDTGVALGGVPVRLARELLEADLRIAIGGVMPHPFAGYSGGGKMLIPGLAGLDVVARTHTFALMGLSGGADLAKNRFRQDMERAVRAIGLHWTINVVVSGKRRIAAVTAGDFVTAHREAAAAAARSGATRAPGRPLDALVVNAYPKDTELLQIEAALVPLRTGAMEWLSPEAPIVLMAPCAYGLGRHQLFEPGGTVYRKPARKTFFGKHQLFVHAPGASDEEVGSVFWDGYPAVRRWEDVLAALAPLMPAQPRIGVLPYGPLHVPEPMNQRT